MTTGSVTKREGQKHSERKEKETKTGQRTYSWRRRPTESRREGAVLHRAPLKWMKSAPSWLKRELHAAATHTRRFLLCSLPTFKTFNSQPIKIHRTETDQRAFVYVYIHIFNMNLLRTVKVSKRVICAQLFSGGIGFEKGDLKFFTEEFHSKCIFCC